MNAMKLVIGEILPFVTLAVLVLGLGYRIRKWHRAAVANLALYPAASNKKELWGKVLGEVLLFRSFRKEHAGLWWQTWPFHVAIALIVLGHTRLITDWPLRVLFGMSAESVDTFSAWAGGFAGIVAMATCLFLLMRRFTVRRVSEISSGEDYTVVILLLAIITTGNVMRFFTHFDITAAQLYFATLFSFQATQVPHDPMFLLHSLLAQLLLIYVPFGKLLHIPGIFYSKPLIVKDF
jgi:nitrate reductase gamma subunit